MMPTVGRVVIVEGDTVKSNGTNVAPAVITRVWSPPGADHWMVNVMAFPDNGHPKAVTSVKLYRDQRAAEAANTVAGAVFAYWPPRV